MPANAPIITAVLFIYFSVFSKGLAVVRDNDVVNGFRHSASGQRAVLGVENVSGGGQV